MDPISLVGALLVLIGVFVGALLKGVSPVAFFTVPAAFLIVVLPTFVRVLGVISVPVPPPLPSFFQVAYPCEPDAAIMFFPGRVSTSAHA